MANKQRCADIVRIMLKDDRFDPNETDKTDVIARLIIEEKLTVCRTENSASACCTQWDD